MKKKWWILIVIILFPMVLIFGVGFINYLTTTKSNKEIYLDTVKENVFHSSIKRIYREKTNHNVLTLEGDHEIYTVYPNWEYKFKVGDSISKDSGSLKLKHYRDDNLLEILDYNDIYIREEW